MFHIAGNLDKAINLDQIKIEMILNISLDTKRFFFQRKLFICNSPHIINSYFSEVFEYSLIVKKYLDLI